MRILFIFLLFLALFSYFTYAGPTISEVYPDTWVKGDDDEYVAISVDSNQDQITLSDGEGTVNISPKSSGKGKVILARNGEAFKKTWGILSGL